MASTTSLSAYLHRRNATAAKATVQIRFVYQRQTYYISTGIRVDVDQWDARRSCLKVNRKAGTADLGNQLIEETNRQIAAALHRAKEVFTQAERDGIEVTPNYLKETLKHKAASEACPDTIPQALVLEAWDLFIDHTRKGLKIGEATLKAYTHARNHVAAFAKARKYRLTFEVLTPQIAGDIVAYLRSKNLTDTTCGGVIKNLKVFCRWAYEHGHNPNQHYQRFKKPTPNKTDFVYLTHAEFEQFASAALPPHLDRIRDLFILQAATGLRHSDLANLKPENRQGNRLTIVTIKTKDPLTIPLSPAAQAIYAKYEGEGLPKVLVNQAYNREVKEAARLAGIDTLVPFTIIKGASRTDTTLPKYEKISSHTARRTFIIHALERGVRPEVLMKVTGHKDIKTLMRYVAITPNIVDAEFERAWAQKVPDTARHHLAKAFSSN